MSERADIVTQWIFALCSVSSAVQVGPLEADRAVIEHPSARALRPVYGGGAEVREAILRPQSALPSEAIPVVGLGGKPRVTPCLVGDAGQPRQKQEA